MRLSHVLCSIALTVALSIGAGQAQEIHPSTNAASYPYQTVETLTSQSGEGKLVFLKRVGARLVALGQATETEYCGYIAQRLVPDAPGSDTGQTQYSVTITTNGSHLACVEHDEAVAAGFTNTQVTIHCHGYSSNFQVNAADVALTGGLFRIHAYKGGRDQDTFSPQDRRAAGYLAGRRGLLYQDGQGREADFGAYDRVPDYSQMARLAAN